MKAAREAPKLPTSSGELLALDCRDLSPPFRLEGHALAAWRALVPRWTLRGDAVERRYRFDDYLAALAFAGSIGWLAHRQQHHPDIHLCFDACTVRWRTHEVDGLSAKDFVCAAQCDARYVGVDD